MRKALVLILVVAFVFTVGCGGLRTAGKVIQTSLPAVEFPAIRNTTGVNIAASGQGVSISGHNFVVTNNTPYWGISIVYGKPLGEQVDKDLFEISPIAPFGSIWDELHFEPLDPQIPIVITFYRDQQLTDYVGVAGRIFQVVSGYGGSVQWTVNSWDIQSPSSRIETSEVIPAAPSLNNARSEKVKFPREWWNATSGAQFVNNIPGTVAQFRVNGRDTGRMLPTGAVYFVAARNIGNAPGTQNITVQVVVSSAEGRVPFGTVEYSVYVPTRGIVAYQYIINNWNVRRY